MCHKWPLIYSVCRNHTPVLSSFISSHNFWAFSNDYHSNLLKNSGNCLSESTVSTLTNVNKEEHIFNLINISSTIFQKPDTIPPPHLLSFLEAPLTVILLLVSCHFYGNNFQKAIISVFNANWTVCVLAGNRQPQPVVLAVKPFEYWAFYFDYVFFFYNLLSVVIPLRVRA